MSQFKDLSTFISLFPSSPLVMDTLMKLRLVITMIFLFSTIAIILVFVTLILPAVILFLLSYLMVFVLMIKLFIVREL